MERDEETDLARRLLARDAGAFDRFVRHFGGKIFHYSWMMCGHREDAEEVAQETLMRVFENLKQLKDPAHVRGWVFRIAKNVCLMKRRRSVFAPSPGKELSLDEVMPAKSQRDGAVRLEVADWRRGPDDEVAASEMHALLREALGDLPETYRGVLILRDIEELSTKETAELLDIGEDAVKQRLHRGRLALRKAMDARMKGGAHENA